MSIYRQVIDDKIVNRIEVSDLKDGGIPRDWPDYDTYELETEYPPPQIGSTQNSDGSWEPPPSPEPPPGSNDVPAMASFEERLAAVEAALSK